MLNLLRADFYRLKRSKPLYICSAAVGIFTALVMINTIFPLVENKETIYPNTLQWIYLLFNESGLLPTSITIFQAIFITMFITTEFNTGTIRDSVSLGYGRIKIFTSKLITVFSGSIIMMFAAIISTLIVSILVLGVYGSFIVNDLFQLALMMLVEGLLFMAFASVFVMIAFIIKNTGGAMSVSICLILFFDFAVSGAQDGLWRYLWLLMNISPVAVPNPEIDSIKIAITVAFSYLIVCIAIGGFVFNKQDIK
ncbi:hypothetical protein AF332_14920 [Sporosarcina globispora]|uniref:ABC transporter permease n=1 Tax=Sporosarcina globispora TaxID=1459 RepID=A0A0M0GET6_SPOGL|nr:ABC transporter permease [Sporosarcina globispora]KON87987.1 hypothetical protein AF332_14920 [Sporosarcina globispora]